MATVQEDSAEFKVPMSWSQDSKAKASDIMQSYLSAMVATWNSCSVCKLSGTSSFWPWITLKMISA